MHHSRYSIADVFSGASLLLMDSTIKGTLLLLVAMIVAIILRRDSAATRHYVWLLAVMAMLAVPALSALLPQWRVLPFWASISSTAPVISTRTNAVDGPAVEMIDVAPNTNFPEMDASNAIAHQPVASQVESQSMSSTVVTQEANTAPVSQNWNVLNVLPVIWAIGFVVLLLRLLAAWWVLWKTERQGTIIGSSITSTRAPPDPLLTSLTTAADQLRVGHRIKLLIHADKTIPVVWGIFQSRLLLPETVRYWSAEQLQSVLLHELAHIKRRDTIAQLLSQIACAVHWFNPLLWMAVWRLGVERERACDDLVLASGVRASTYAGHLLDIVTKLSPTRGLQSCGLAMARKSSLEGRLMAVLSKNLNRRTVSVTLATLALAIALGIAVPLAMLRAGDEQISEKTSDKPATSVTDREPQHESAQSLFRKWQTRARTDGKIPGALIGHVAHEIDSFLKQHPDDEKARKLAALRPRFDASRDWAQTEVVTLLDDITTISTAPISWAETPLEFDEMRTLKPGTPLPVGLAQADWGKAATNGLRAAWLLQPQADRYPLGSVLKSRVLIHNSGKAPVIFMTETWHQSDPHTARNAKGEAIKVSGTFYTGITPLTTYRLAPGDYCEVSGHGIAIGAGKYEEEFSVGTVGAIIEAKQGDDVRLSHTVDLTYGGWTRPSDPKDPLLLWKKNIADRVEREAPMPSSAADREQLIRNVTLDLFGEAPNAEDITAFIAETSPNPLAELILRLQARPQIEHFSGKLPTGETKFQVTAPDLNAAKAPRTANGPGRYVLSDHVHLLVSQRTAGNLRTNSARIAFFSPDPKIESPHQPYVLTLPDGLLTWAIAWERGTGVLWIIQKGLVRKCDFSNPQQVHETRFESDGINVIPEQFHEPLKAVLSLPGAPVQKQRTLNPQEDVKLQPGVASDQPAPKEKEAQALFKLWQTQARRNGNIPGGLVGQLGNKVNEFIRNNTGDGAGDPFAKKMAPLVPRFDASRDWTPTEIVALLNDVAAAHTIPLETTYEETARLSFRQGAPLPAELSNAPWGEAQPNGLRMAWYLEPSSKLYRLGTPLKSRILFHNSGKDTVVFRTRSWHQSANHKARDEQERDIAIESTSWTTIGWLVPFRLKPGEFVEIIGAGIGIGKMKDSEDWRGTRVGAWIDAKEGDIITFTPDSVPLNDWNEVTSPEGESTWWRDFIKERLKREQPLPNAAEDRAQLLDRVMRELFGTPPSAQETAEFTMDSAPDALDSLAKRLALRPGTISFAGSLTSGSRKFRVLPVDPEAATRPRTASNPGRYTLCELARLVVSRRPDGTRIVNLGSIEFYSADPKADAPGKPVTLELPDGYNTWAAAWVRGGKVLWLQTKSGIRSYDFTNPAQVKEATFETPVKADQVPEPSRNALHTELKWPETPMPTPAATKKGSEK